MRGGRKAVEQGTGDLLALVLNGVRERLLVDPAVSDEKSRNDNVNGVSKVVHERVGALPLTKSAFSHEDDDLANHDRSVDDARHTDPILLLDDSNRSNQIERTEEENFHPHVSLVEHRASHDEIIKVRSPDFMKGLNERLRGPDGIFASLLQFRNIGD